MSSINCRICNTALTDNVLNVNDTRFGIPTSYTIKQCTNCGLLQLGKLLKEDEITKLYETYYNYTGTVGGNYSLFRTLFFTLFDRIWTTIDSDVSFHKRKGIGRLLDVGCNEGRNLIFYRNNGFDAEGLEVNLVAARVAQNKNLTVHIGTVDDFIPDKLYNVIVLSNVLEHVNNPLKILKSVNHMLAPDGQIWISCPNVESWQRYLFGKFWINWHVPFHTVHFSRSLLVQLLSHSGFDLKDVHTETPSLWMAHSFIVSLFSRTGLPTILLRNPFWVAGLMLLFRIFLFPLIWIGNVLGKGDCLVLTATNAPRK